MTQASVSVAKAARYKKEEILSSLLQVLELLGNPSKIIPPRSKVFVKINGLSPMAPPERAIYTHPEFTAAVCLLLKKLECQIIVGDDVPLKARDPYLVSGYRQVCEDLNIKLVNLRETGFCKIQCQGKVLKETYVSNLLFTADFIINLPKLKTHSFTVYTGGIKNMYGIIPHGLRLEYHDRYRKPEIFSQMLVDLFAQVPPHLTIMDAIRGMEKEGPAAGLPRNTGLILASQDAVALDAVASYLIGLAPLSVFTTLYAHEQNLGMGELQKIEVRGEKLSEIKIPDFKHSAYATGLMRRKLPQFVFAFVQTQLMLIPVVDKGRCSGCLDCLENCPRKAIILEKGKAFIRKKHCIHCMCCHESCLIHAIKIKHRPLGKAINFFKRFSKRMKNLFSRSRNKVEKRHKKSRTKHSPNNGKRMASIFFYKSKIL